MNKKILFGLLGLIALAGIFYAGNYMVKKNAVNSRVAYTEIFQAPDNNKTATVTSVSEVKDNPIVQATTSSMDTLGIYYSSKYGISFPYPRDFIKDVVWTGELIRVPYADFSPYSNSGMNITLVPIDTIFKVAMDSYTLRYDPQSRLWMKNIAITNSEDIFPKNYIPTCEKVFMLGGQKIPSYDVSYKYPTKRAIIVKQGLLLITEVPVEQPISPQARDDFKKILDSITFDNPGDVISALCK